jgi:5-methyltetrahydrofolate--homocysteine methyltransferase
MSDQLVQALSDLEEELVLKLVQDRLDAGDEPLEVIAACREGMADVGKRYEAQEYYVSDLIMAGEVFKQAMSKIGENFQTDSGPKRGTVVIGTVAGDIHDIGKDIVVSLLQAGNYNVVDLGVDVPPEKFVEATKESSAAVVGLSGLLTISFDAMKETVDALKAAGLPVKVMVGGGPVSEQVRDHVGADALGIDAQAAVSLCDNWFKAMEEN